MLIVRQNRVGVQKLFRRFGRFSLLVALSFSTLLAEESFKDFKRSQTDSFKEYKDERDGAFSNYLKQEWEAYTLQEMKSLYEKQKPITIEPAKPKEVKPVGPKISIKIEAEKEPKEDLTPIQKEPAISPPPQKRAKDISFDFYGKNLEFDISDGVKRANFYPTNQIGIANYFDAVASSEYESLVLEIQRVSKSMNLNDWGTYLLVSKISQNLYENEDTSKLLRWFLLNKLGYAVKIGLDGRHIVLMHYSAKTIYAAPNFNFSNKKYYVFFDRSNERIDRVFSYKQNYPGATKPLDLSLDALPLLGENLEYKVLSFYNFDKKYDVAISYNKNLIDFMASYPQAEYETFFNAPIEQRTYRDLAAGIKKHIDGKKASEAMNFVLSFVQKSFKYEQDNQQFGKEKVMFAQETLFYEKSDCEDRAVLFSYLMKELFGVSVLGVKYEDHMATALYIPLDGDKIRAGSKEYVIADPTYINSTIGMGMPKYRSVKPQSYIVVKNN
ncbi:MAG: hypothetical protein RQ763_06675 [Sulfurimonas sp.]|uniref:hypothetical protein n=1 Tax=Sulfurimonas sp. TaxID=2022749 RepID=UPI0028CDF109|nr:hypothetical protein [Sulfurimonas sp.]MDT8338865.1 hypothetical protein [Sulfurimonas sp.]